MQVRRLACSYNPSPARAAKTQRRDKAVRTIPAADWGIAGEDDSGHLSGTLAGEHDQDLPGGHGCGRVGDKAHGGHESGQGHQDAAAQRSSRSRGQGKKSETTHELSQGNRQRSPVDESKRDEVVVSKDKLKDNGKSPWRR